MLSDGRNPAPHWMLETHLISWDKPPLSILSTAGFRKPIHPSCLFFPYEYVTSPMVC